MEKFGVLEQLKPTSVLREKHRTRESSDGCFPMTKAKENPLDVAPDRIVSSISIFPYILHPKGIG